MAGEVGIEDVTLLDPAGDFEAIYAMSQPRIAGYLARMVGDPDVAADLTQDVFLKAFRAIGQTKPGLNVKAWLFTIATNAALDHHRHRRLLRWLPLHGANVDPPEIDPHGHFGAKEELEDVL